MLRMSCMALKDVVKTKLGEAESPVWDGNYEYAKDEWAGLLAFTPYTKEQLVRVQEVLAPFEASRDDYRSDAVGAVEPVDAE